MALTAKKVYAILKRQISDMEAKINSPVRYRGTVATADLLPLNPDIGDMYNIESKSVYGEAGMNVAWNGVVWDTMGAPIDMSLYIKSSELADWVKQQNKPAYTAEEVGALPADTKIPSKTSDLQNDSGFLTKIPDNYLSGTDKTLSASGKAADAKVTGDKFSKTSADLEKKLDKNQGSENSGKIAGINESGDIVPMFPVGVEYNSETNCLEFGSDQKMELNQGIGLDSSLTKAGYAADAGVVGEVTNSLKEDISNKITKFYASNQGETHLADSDNGKIMDMMVYGKSSQNKTTGKNLLKIKDTTKTVRGVTVTSKDGIITVNGTATETGWTYINIDTQILTDGTYIVNYEAKNNDSKLLLADTQGKKVIEQNVATTLSNAEIDKVCFVITKGETYNMTNVKVQLELGSSATSYEPYTGGIPSPNPDYPQEIKSVVNPTVKVSNEDGTESQTVTLPYTLNAIPVSSGGNVTINGQSYIADRILEKNGVFGIERWIDYVNISELDKTKWLFRNDVPTANCTKYSGTPKTTNFENIALSNIMPNGKANIINFFRLVNMTNYYYQFNLDPKVYDTVDKWVDYITKNNVYIYYKLAESAFEPFPEELQAKLRALSTNYPVTNISITSDQLDGYTVFNYPISMANGWNYVKQQLNDNRDYIYDMDLQSAEAYVNSEYAVALTELEV